MENTFGSYKTPQRDGNERKREVVDKYEAEASVGHATVFQRVSPLEDGSKSKDEGGKGNQTKTKEDDNVYQRRRNMSKSMNETASIISTGKSTQARSGMHTAKTNSTVGPDITRNRGAVTFAPRRNSQHSKITASQGEETSRARSVSLVAKVTSNPSRDEGSTPQSHRRNGATSATRQGRTKTWAFTIVTRSPQAKESQNASQDRRTSNTGRRRTTSSRQSQSKSTAPRRSANTETSSGRRDTFSSRRVHGVMIVTDGAAANNRGRSSNKSRTSSLDAEDVSAVSEDWDNVFSGSWGERKEKSL